MIAPQSLDNVRWRFQNTESNKGIRKTILQNHVGREILFAKGSISALATLPATLRCLACHKLPLCHNSGALAPACSSSLHWQRTECQPSISKTRKGKVSALKNLTAFVDWIPLILSILDHSGGGPEKKGSRKKFLGLVLSQSFFQGPFMPIFSCQWGHYKATEVAERLGQRQFL